MQQLLIATKNPGKFAEMKAILDDLPLEILGLADLRIEDDFEEKEGSFEENASGKAKFFYDLGGILTLADDSGIEIPVLEGEFGVKTRRWGGENVSDEEWVSKFLKKMEEFPSEEQRSAKFICLAAIIGDEIEKLFRGEAKGVITKGLEAQIIPGIPLSSCFRPEGFDKVYAALTPEEKGQISHRGLAVGRVRRWLEVMLQENV